MGAQQVQQTQWRTSSLDLKRGDLRQLGDGTGDARPIFDRKLLSQGCFDL
jgi:hypothetical protein